MNIRRFLHKLVTSKPRFIVHPFAKSARKNIAVMGAGAWGTALAVLAARKNDVTLWSYEASHIEQLKQSNENSKYLPDHVLPEVINYTSDVGDLQHADMVFMVVPAQTLRQNLESIKDIISKKAILIICCKGIENGSMMLMSEVLKQVMPSNPCCILSGPNFAHEVAEGLPTATTLACEDDEIAQKVIAAISYEHFRVYYAEDIIAPQVAAAVKNVMAIGCGIAAGQGFGENAQAALITRGMHEISRLTHALEGEVTELLGLSGMGDLLLTCGSKSSRNYSFGLAIGQGAEVHQLLEDTIGVVEGYSTAKAIHDFSRKHKIEMPICEAVYKVLYSGYSVEKAVKSLLRRPIKI